MTAIRSYIDTELSAMSRPERVQALLERAVEGDKQAFGALYEIYMDEIYRYFFYRLGHVQDAEDMTERTFLKVWESLDRFETGRASFRTWLYRVAHNLLVDHYRTDKPTDPLPDEPVKAPEAGPEGQVESTQFGAELHAALGQLKPDYQQILTLRFVSDLSHSEAAQVLDRSEGAVRVLQHRALKALREVLERTLA